MVVTESATPVPPQRGRWRRGGLLSPLTWRILAVNMMAPFVLVAGLLYLDRYKNELIDAELDSLRIRAEMVAAAMSELGVNDAGVIPKLDNRKAGTMLLRLFPTASPQRARLFDWQGDQIADSRSKLGNPMSIEVEDLTPPDHGLFNAGFRRLYDFLMSTRLGGDNLPIYEEPKYPRAISFPEVMKAQDGGVGTALRNTPDHKLILSTAVPIQQYRRVLGEVLLESSGEDINRSLFKVRLTIFQAFAFALVITTTLSLYLANSIVRPIRRLAMAAERVRRGRGRRHLIPDLGRRRDEIGELADALREMTETLWRRMDAIEAFAADVAHEIKNPLTSLRSAVETVGLAKNVAQRDKLMAIIQDDVDRLDRLISDISDASRVDAELSRADTTPVSLRDMLTAIAAVYTDSGVAPDIAVRVEGDAGDALAVIGIEGRLGQILRNLLQNAVSFSPPGGTLVLRGRRDGDAVAVDVEDDGPGIPPNKLDAIFDRFYSERPEAEKFGTHSGLGLSISRQIAEAHGGSLRASNRCDADGKVIGARFTLRLPPAPPAPRTDVKPAAWPAETA